jgi:Phytanoyl-CoA dioxygenase (PhyH)
MGSAVVTDEARATDVFADRGYLILRGVLNSDEVEVVRELCAAHLSDAGTEMRGSDFLKVSELARIPIHPRVLPVIRELFGERFRLYPTYTARKNVYIPWHVDDAFAGTGREYVWAPEFLHVQGGLYLQDNNPSTGGGIDVIRGSHLMSFDGYGTTRPQFEVAGWTLANSSLRESVDTRAGDVILWNARLMHASTPVQREPDREKFGVFFSYGRDDLCDNSRFLCQLVANRVRTMNGISGLIPRLAEIADIRYPASFPEWFVKEAEAAGVSLVTL